MNVGAVPVSEFNRGVSYAGIHLFESHWINKTAMDSTALE